MLKVPQKLFEEAAHYAVTFAAVAVGEAFLVGGLVAVCVAYHGKLKAVEAKLAASESNNTETPKEEEYEIEG